MGKPVIFVLCTGSAIGLAEDPVTVSCTDLLRKTPGWSRYC
ncbi:MAG: hypothetical protein PHR05_07615 [Bacteroidales bacterium]|nr:hypothetical protein [Bacteroidales bacterium]MDD3944040.1 hypothetical protein [Bacteroidales bacterium]